MGKLVHATMKTAIDGFLARDKQSVSYVLTQESATDHLQNDLTFYLAKLTEKDLTTELAQQIPPLLHAINDFERIGDHAVNIAELTQKVRSDSLKFSNNALAEMRTMYAKVEDMFDQTLNVVRCNDTYTADRIMRYEEEINAMQREYSEKHAQRLCRNKCAPFSALVFVDFINNLEKIADHLTNITQASRSNYAMCAVQDTP